MHEKLKFWTGIVAQLVAMAAVGWGVVEWTGQRIFAEQLDAFHAEAMPAIEKRIDEKVELRSLEIMNDVNQRLARIEEQNAKTDEQLDRIEKILWEMNR
jgi:hypothetical protein